MRQFLESFVWAFLLLFTIPSVLIVASWSSLPGEPMFGVKLGLEQSLAFVVAPSYSASTQLAFQYTERRFIDARTLLSEKHSVTGLVYLTRQVEQTQKTIEKTPDTTARAEAAKTYIATLEEVSGLLEEQKNTMLAQAAGVPVPPPGGKQDQQPEFPGTEVGQAVLPTATPTPAPTPTPISTLPPAGRPTPTTAAIPSMNGISTASFRQGTPKPTPTPTPTSTPTSTPTPKPTPTPTPTPPPPAPATQAVPATAAVVAQEITQTQASIKETIKELKKQSEQTGESTEDQRRGEKMKGDNDRRNRRESGERDKGGRNR